MDNKGMQRLKLSFLVIAAILFGQLIAIQPSNAADCSLYKGLIADAQTKGDIAAAAKYVQQQQSCNAANAAGKSTSNVSPYPGITCANASTQAVNAMTSGDVAKAAFLVDFAKSCQRAAASSSSGSSAGSTSGSTSCTGVPEIPKVDLSYNELGILLTFTPSLSGEKTNQVQVTTTMYSPSLKAWGAWSSWQSLQYSGFSIPYQISYSDLSSRVAYAVISVNNCGASAQVRENSEFSGITLTNSLILAAAEKAAADSSAALAKAAADAKTAADKAAADSSAALAKAAADAKTAAEKAASDSSAALAKAAADAKTAAEKAAADAKTAAEKAAAESQAAAVRAEAEQLIVDAKMEAVRILAAAKAKALAMTKKTTITCVKGKLIKKVTALKPVCPKGYKKK